MPTHIINSSASAPTKAEDIATSTILKGGYGDPPYVGQALKRYRDDPKCAEVDHEALIHQLNTTYDGCLRTEARRFGRAANMDSANCGFDCPRGQLTDWPGLCTMNGSDTTWD